MKIKYDTNADAAYMSVAPGKIQKTVPLNEHIIIDFDSRQNIVGIELLGVSHLLRAVIAKRSVEAVA